VDVRCVPGEEDPPGAEAISQARRHLVGARAQHLGHCGVLVGGTSLVDKGLDVADVERGGRLGHRGDGSDGVVRQW